MGRFYPISYSNRVPHSFATRITLNYSLSTELFSAKKQISRVFLFQSELPQILTPRKEPFLYDICPSVSMHDSQVE